MDEYDSQARHYYPAIARTTTMDPLAEKYYNISPYAWCANNPINVVDLNGMYISDEDSTEISGPLQERITTMIDSINSSGGANEDRIKELQQTLIDIIDIINDPNILYVFNISQDPSTYHEISDNSISKVYINYISGDNGSLVHELRHGGQYARRDIDKDYNGYNVYSEVDAYRAQVAYLGETYFLIPLQETGEVPSFSGSL